jgi:radical SAM-linked protein
MTEDVLTRFRIHFHKTSELRYIGHLDLHRSLERALRRANLPLDYSRGFNPRVKLNLSTALPLGCSSTTELADFWLQSELQEEQVLQALQAVVPPGLLVISIEKIDPKLPSLQSSINAISYHVKFLQDVDQVQLAGKIHEVIVAEQLIRLRRGKQYDLQPLIQALELVQQPPDPPVLRMVLLAGEGKTGRPEEVLLELGLDPAETLIERTQLFLTE